MERIDLLSDLDRIENELSGRLKFHNSFNLMKQKGGDYIYNLLLERRWVSFQFTFVFDRLIDCLEPADGLGRRVAREIIREEYPDDTDVKGILPSHRERLFDDLLAIGIEKERIFSSRPSNKTKDHIEELHNIVSTICEERESRTLRSLSFLRFWGEILTSEEYQKYWDSGLSKLFEMPSNSSFYLDHIEHDTKTKSFIELGMNVVEATGSHSDRLARAMISEIKTSKEVEIIGEVCEKALACKLEFYEQFS